MQCSVRTVVSVILSLLVVGCAGDSGGELQHRPVGDSRTINSQFVDIACGQCQFDMQGTGCRLAIKLDGKSFFVTGSDIDDHGDAHAADGMCNCVRRAKVSGTLKEGMFHADHIELLVDSRSADVNQ